MDKDEQRLKMIGASIKLIEGALTAHPVKVTLEKPDGTLIATLVDAAAPLGALPVSFTPAAHKDLPTGALRLREAAQRAFDDTVEFTRVAAINSCPFKIPPINNPTITSTIASSTSVKPACARRFSVDNVDIMNVSLVLNHVKKTFSNMNRTRFNSRAVTPAQAGVTALIDRKLYEPNSPHQLFDPFNHREKPIAAVG